MKISASGAVLAGLGLATGGALSIWAINRLEGASPVAALNRVKSANPRVASKAITVKASPRKSGYPELATPALPKGYTYKQEETPEWYEQDLGVEVPQIMPQTPSY